MSKKLQLIVFISVLTVTGVLAGLGSVYFIRNQLTQSLIEEETSNNLNLTQQTAILLEKEISTIQEKVNLVARMPQIQDGDTGTCNKKLAEVAPDLKAQMDNITRFNTKFTLDCAINKAAIGYVLTPESPIKAIIQDPEHKPNLSYSGYSPVSKQEVLYLNLPVFSTAGNYYGIIGGVIYLNYISDKYFKHIDLGQGGYVTLIDDNGGYLYHPDTANIGKKIDAADLTKGASSPALHALNQKILADVKNDKSGTVRFKDQNQEMVVSYAPANVEPGRKWVVALTVPTQAIVSKLQQSHGFGGRNTFVYLYGSVIISFTLFSTLILLLVLRGFFTPLIRIKNITTKIGQGDMDVEIDSRLLKSKNEFGQLARAIQEMAAKLRESRLTLEQKIKDRTAELEKSNLDIEMKAAELAKTNKFMMDRELKMVELKKTLKANKGKAGPEET